MQTILHPDQMQLLETQAFALGVHPLLLMEQAAREAHNKLSNFLQGVQNKHILYLIGPGNNGGDGLAMARLCLLSGGVPHILLAREPSTKDAITNLVYTKALGIEIKHWTGKIGDAWCDPRPDAVVDGMFGTGFRGGLPEDLRILVQTINQMQVPSFALDIPSGVNGLTGSVENLAFRADHTLCFGHLKTGLCLWDALDYAGQLHVLSLGLPEDAYHALTGQELLSALEPADLLLLIPPRRKQTHKGDCGRVLLYMGSMGMAGAAVMAAQAALASLRAGAGLVTLVCEKDMIPIVQNLVPNAMCADIAQAATTPPACDVLAVGCGLGQSAQAWQNILSLWDKDKPSVWDADALNMLAMQPMHLGEKAVLTPHPGEAARLLGKSIQEIISSPLQAARDLQEKFGGTIVIKGAYSVIKGQGQTAFNLVGSPALAKGGSGDALCGIIASLLAQGLKLNAFETVQTACLWHGMAGIAATDSMDERAVLTSDVIECLGSVLKRETK